MRTAGHGGVGHGQHAVAPRTMPDPRKHERTAHVRPGNAPSVWGEQRATRQVQNPGPAFVLARARGGRAYSPRECERGANTLCAKRSGEFGADPRGGRLLARARGGRSVLRRRLDGQVLPAVPSGSLGTASADMRSSDASGRRRRDGLMDDIAVSLAAAALVRACCARRRRRRPGLRAAGRSPRRG